ncbi:MAG: DUF1858 domain-containing protein [Chloroflexi bacterium]|nr:DUF1858 domain-containing protein [Chloroflexota bacterium]
MDITSQTKLFDLLEAYPALEEQIIAIAPPFKNLKNPVLRRAVGRLATLEKVAQIGGLNVDQFVNTLRRAAGQTELHPAQETKPYLPEISAEDPEWTRCEPQFVVNGVELLQQGQVPLTRINELLPKLSPGRFLLLITDFEPSPMLEAMQKQNRELYSKISSDVAQLRLTFIR